jgi:hypothetical protein
MLIASSFRLRPEAEIFSFGSNRYLSYAEVENAGDRNL